MIHATTILHFALRDFPVNSPYSENKNGANSDWVEGVIELAKLMLGQPVVVQKLCSLPPSARAMVFSELAANPHGHRLYVVLDPYERHLVPKLQEIAEGKRTEISMSYEWGGFSGCLIFPGKTEV